MAKKVIIMGKFRGIYSALDVGDLCGRKSNHIIIGIIAEIRIKIVKITSGSTHNNDFFNHLLLPNSMPIYFDFKMD